MMASNKARLAHMNEEMAVLHAIWKKIKKRRKALNQEVAETKDAVWKAIATATGINPEEYSHLEIKQVDDGSWVLAQEPCETCDAGVFVAPTMEGQPLTYAAEAELPEPIRDIIAQVRDRNPNVQIVIGKAAKPTTH